MTCQAFADFIADYLDDVLPSEVKTEFKRHLSVCRNCLAYLRTYEATVRLGLRAFDDPDEPVSSEVPEELVQAVLRARQ